jgi:P pilus assembly chaperone PapD
VLFRPAVFTLTPPLILAAHVLLYDGAKKEVSLSVRNPDSTPYLIQTVVSNLNDDAQKRRLSSPRLFIV